MINFDMLSKQGTPFEEPSAASRPWPVAGHYATWYVAQLPGEDGVDWGYTDKPDQARVLNRYWQRRFYNDTLACRSKPHFYRWTGELPKDFNPGKHLEDTDRTDNNG